MTITADRLDQLWTAIAQPLRDTTLTVSEADGGAGDVYQQSERFRRQLLDLEAKAVGATMDAWLSVRTRLDQILDELEKAYDLAFVPEASRQAALDRFLDEGERFEALLIQVRERIDDFTRQIRGDLDGTQARAAEMGAGHASQLAQMQLGDQAVAGIAFDRLPADAVEQLVAQLQTRPVHRILGQLGPEVEELARLALTDGLALGHNPRQVAPDLARILRMPQWRALSITRTETMRAYREATRRSLTRNSRVVVGWRWSASLDSRTCAMCWAMHGTLFPPDEIMATHPNCRCSPAPQTKSYAEMGIPGVEDGPNLQLTPGPDLFAAQPGRVQLSVLGPAKWQAYSDGRLALPDLVGQRYDNDWGPVRFEKALRDVLGDV